MGNRGFIRKFENLQENGILHSSGIKQGSRHIRCHIQQLFVFKISLKNQMKPEIKRKSRPAQPMVVKSQIKKQKLKNTPEKGGNDTIAMNTKPTGPTGWELLEEPKNNNQSKSGFEITCIYIYFSLDGNAATLLLLDCI